MASPTARVRSYYTLLSLHKYDHRQLYVSNTAGLFLYSLFPTIESTLQQDGRDNSPEQLPVAGPGGRACYCGLEGVPQIQSTSKLR